MRNHNKNDKFVKNEDNEQLVSTVKHLINILYFQNVEYKTQMTQYDANKIGTMIIRKLYNSVSLTNNIDKNMRILMEDYIDTDLLVSVLREYVYDKVHITKPDYIFQSVKCFHIKECIEEMFSVEIDPKSIGLVYNLDVYCTCGTICEYDATPITYIDGVRQDDLEMVDEGELDELEALNSTENSSNDNQSFDNQSKETRVVVTTQHALSRFFRKKVYTKYVCPNCGNFCLTHNGTDIPFGIPADEKTRSLRAIVHRELDSMFRTKQERTMLYKRLAYFLDKPITNMHIGELSLAECSKAIYWIKTEKAKNIESNDRPLENLDKQIQKAFEY